MSSSKTNNATMGLSKQVNSDAPGAGVEFRQQHPAPSAAQALRALGLDADGSVFQPSAQHEIQAPGVDATDSLLHAAHIPVFERVFAGSHFSESPDASGPSEPAESEVSTSAGGAGGAASEEESQAGTPAASATPKAKQAADLPKPSTKEMAMAVAAVQYCHKEQHLPIPGNIKHVVVMLHPEEQAFQQGEYWSNDRLRQICAADWEHLEVRDAENPNELFRVYLKKKTGLVLDSPVHFLEPGTFVLPKSELEPFVNFFATVDFGKVQLRSLFGTAKLLFDSKDLLDLKDLYLGKAHAIVHYCHRAGILAWDKQKKFLVPGAPLGQPQIKVVAEPAAWKVLAGQMRSMLWAAQRPIKLSEVKQCLLKVHGQPLNETKFGHKKLKTLLEDPQLLGVCVQGDYVYLEERAPLTVVVRNTFLHVVERNPEPRFVRARSAGPLCSRRL